MAYSKTTWATGDTITATKLNNIENGIGTADSSVESLNDSIDSLNSSVTSLNNSVTSLNSDVVELANIFLDRYPVQYGSLSTCAGQHNCFYRGKFLMDSLSDDQAAAIKNGSFDDLYIGDYWCNDHTKYTIAAFDYYLGAGDTNCTTHHVVVVMDYDDAVDGGNTAQMNSTATTEGGYVGSLMYTEGLDTAKELATSFFGDHILSHRVYLTNAMVNGRASAAAWYDSTVELMTESMVFGSTLLLPMGSGSSAYINNRVETSQLPLFAMNPVARNIRSNYWLRDITTSTTFEAAYMYGYPIAANATQSMVVRPIVCITG